MTSVQIDHLAPTTILDRTNYHEWSVTMKWYLCAKKVWEVVEEGFEFSTEEEVKSMTKAQLKEYDGKKEKDMMKSGD